MASHGEDNSISTHRLEAFSDGVFAIAITLLILEIKVPGHDMLDHESLSRYLLRIWPKYFAYVMSFIAIGIYWSNHHYIFKLYTKTNHIFNLMNVIFLMAIAFLPFPTAVFGDYIMDDMQRKSAVTFYAIGIYLPALVWLLMWWYAIYERRLIDHRLSDSFIQYLTRQYIFSNFIYIVAIIVSLYNSTISIFINIGLTALYLLPPKKPEYS